MNDALQQLLDRLTALLAEKPLIGAWYTTVVRFVFPLLALMILVGAIRSLWKVKHPDEVWGYLVLRNGVRLPITHWENIIGRAPSCDVQLEYPSVSRQHAALIREDDGSWTIYDLGSKGGIKVNDLPVDEYALVEDGDTVTFAGIPAIMEPITAEEKRAQMVERRIEGKPAGMWGSLVLLTLFQILTGLQLIIAQGDKATTTIPLTFFVFTVICWAYFIVMRLFRRIGFEMETIAFFLCTLSLAVTGSTVPDELPKQLIAILMGLAIFLILGFFLRDLTRAQKVRWFMSATAVGLLAITLLIGSSQGGAKAWLRLGPLSLQTSEIAKICYIFAGAATLDRLFNKRNLWMFIGLTGICGGCLALCPEQAVSEKAAPIGVIERGQARELTVLTGRMNPGNASGSPIIKALYRELDKEDALTIMDCPPGSACLVMESIQADYGVLVAEPTIFGAHNLAMVYELMQVFQKPFGVVLNKCGSGENPSELFCKEHDLTILGRIPYDERLGRLNGDGQVAVWSDEGYRQQFDELLGVILKEAAR